MQLPNLIIIGVFKAATTSLFRYLSEHPEICGSKKKEIHYFSPLVYNTGETLPDISFYKSFFSCQHEIYRLEASPSYFYGGEPVIEKMKQILPSDHKVLLILREPTDRFISYYKHIKAQLLIDDDFELFVDKCISDFANNSEFEIGHYKNAVREGLYIDYLPLWKQHYKRNLKIVFFEDLKRNPLTLLIEISEWLGLNKSDFEGLEYRIENKTINPKSFILHRLAISVYKKCQTVLGNGRAKRFLTDMYRNVNQNEKGKNEIDSDSIEKLKLIYEPYNNKLFKYLDQLPDEWQRSRGYD